MMGCSQIKSLIDEADRPDRLPYEAANHIALCAGCRSFANERESLRGLLASGARVTVPVNFDAMLEKRLREQTAGQSLSWFSSAIYLRLGAATAGILVVIFAVQYSGILSRSNQKQPLGSTDSLLTNNPTPAAQPAEQSLNRDIANNGVVVTVASGVKPVTLGGRQPYHTERGHGYPVVVSNRGTVEADPVMADRQVVIVRGRGGEREIPIPTVSVGAQLHLYGNAARPTAPRPVLTSF